MASLRSARVLPCRRRWLIVCVSEDYEKLKAGWKADEALQETDLFKEESHRIGEPAFLVLRWGRR